MLGTGASLNSGKLGVTLAEEHIATSPEISNIPLSPEVQSHLPSRSDLEQDGYDSDASVDPYAEVADEGPLEVDEPPLQEVGNGDIPVGVVQEDTESGRFTDIPQATLVQMKVSEIKYKLSRCGQPVGGRKVVLLERLKMSLFQQIPIQATNKNPQQTTDNLNGFLQMQNGDHLCQWKKLWKSLTMLHLLCMHHQYLWRMPNSFHRSTTLLKGSIMSVLLEKRKSQNYIVMVYL